MRAVSVASVLLLAVCQFALLRRVLPTGPAVLALLAWQMLCYLTNMANVQYYCVAYFFSQAVGMTFAWAALVLLTWPTTYAWQRVLVQGLGAGCAALAYLCHIVPGVAILGGLGLYFLVRWLRTSSRADLACVVLLGVVCLAAVVGTGQLAHMGQSRRDAGTVPLKNVGLLLAWVPTLLLALFWPGQRWFGKQHRWSPGFSRSSGQKPAKAGTPTERLPAEDLLEVLACVLAVAGILQGFCAVEYLLGRSALYSVNKFFYVLFPVSTLMWLLAGVRGLQRGGLDWQALGARWGLTARLCGTALACLLLYLNGRVFLANELVDEKVGPQRHPMQVVKQLAQERPAGDSTDLQWRSDLIYFDPDLPQTSIFINVVGLRRTWWDAYRVKEALTDWGPGQTPPARLREQVHFSRLVVPPPGEQWTGTIGQ
jgi:hypothetical protein